MNFSRRGFVEILVSGGISAVLPSSTRAEMEGAPAPVAVFQGYESVAGRALSSSAVTGKTETVGGTSGVTCRVCTDLETLSNALEINQSLSVSYGPVGSFDEKMRFVHNLKVTTYSVSIVVFARHTLGKETTTNVKLKNGIKPPQGRAALRNFFRSYGDSYVVSTTRGGEYYAVYTFNSRTREEQSELVASMKAQGILDGVTIDGSMQAKITSFSSSSSVESNFDQNVSGILNPKLPTSDQIIPFALAFPSLALDAPTIIGFGTSGYEHVPAFGGFEPISKNRSFFVGDGVVDGLTKPLVQVRQLNDQISWIQSVYSFYGGYSDAKLTSVGIQAKADQAAIIQLIEQYESDPTQAFIRPPLPSLGSGTPTLAYLISNSPAFGGQGGNAFNDVDSRTFIPQRTKISSIQVRAGDVIDKLMVTYTNSLGRTWTAEHGGNGGRPVNQLDLTGAQFATQTSGRSGNRVDHLTIDFTGGNSFSGGGNGGDAFAVPVPAGSFLLGFAGRCYAELDQISFVYGSFQAATWS
jgi:hypothetical protein